MREGAEVDPDSPFIANELACLYLEHDEDMLGPSRQLGQLNLARP